MFFNFMSNEINCPFLKKGSPCSEIVPRSTSDVSHSLFELGRRFDCQKALTARVEETSIYTCYNTYNLLSIIQVYSQTA